MQAKITEQKENKKTLSIENQTMSMQLALSKELAKITKNY